MKSTRWFVSLLAATLSLALPSIAPAQDDSKAKDQRQDTLKQEQDIPTYSLVEASKKGLVSVNARGSGDGRMTVSVTNRSNRPLRVVLPPGIVAQSATGQFGGMGGMGGGMGGMGGGMGGMGGGGMGGMGGGGMGGMGGGMGGMGGGMGGGGGTMPPMMGMMTLARMIMYFCGDFDSWDMRSLMMGMGGMGMGGGMGGMGGMGGGMGGMMGGGGMRSVPPSTLSYADLRPKQTRNLPTRLVSITPPNPQTGLNLPQKDEELRLFGDVSQVNDDPRVQKALRRLAAQKVSTSVSQLIMWRLTTGMEWNDMAQFAEWATAYEVTLAREFVEHLDQIGEKDGETGTILFQIEGTDAASKAMAAEVTEILKGKTVLGLQAKIGIPARPEGPSVACQVRLHGGDVQVQVASSDGPARKWSTSGKFSLKSKDADGKFDPAKVADGVAEGVISRLVKAQILKEKTRDRGKLIYLVRIDNVSPLILSGLAIQGIGSKPDDPSRALTSLGIPPRKYLTLPASEEVVKALGLKQGIRVTALDLSGL